MDGLNRVDVESGWKVDVESGGWKVESGAVPDLTHTYSIPCSAVKSTPLQNVSKFSKREVMKSKAWSYN